MELPTDPSGLVNHRRLHRSWVLREVKVSVSRPYLPRYTFLKQHWSSFYSPDFDRGGGAFWEEDQSVSGKV